jgi:hypothetical protein
MRLNSTVSQCQKGELRWALPIDIGLAAVQSRTACRGDMIEVADCHHYAVHEQLAQTAFWRRRWRSLPEPIR